jgi:hypothetical protein
MTGIPLPPPGLLHRVRTKYQLIELRRDRRGLFLRLNGSPQVHSAEEREYHDCCSTIPMLLARRCRDVLILGGGDGLAARNVLDFPDLGSCTLIELDAGMIELCARNPYWRELTHGSLTDRRLEVVVGDGIAWLLKTRRRFDVIIHDLEMTFTDQPEELTLERTFDFFAATYAKLTPGGIWVLTVPDDTDERMADAVFAWKEPLLPKSMRAGYRRLRGAIPKVRALLHAQYAAVREVTIAPQALGVHTTFFISNRPIAGFRRRPPVPFTLARAESRVR